MDADDELKRLKWLLIVGVIFLMSAFFSWREMKYMLIGKKADARIVRVYDTTERGRRGRAIEKRVIEYEFKAADGTLRKESDTTARSAAPPAGKTVPIAYLNGSPDSSRLAGSGNKIWLLVFFGSLGFFAYKIIQLVRESKS